MSIPLKFASVSKRYAQRDILCGVDLSIAAGETIGLLGVNGAGKSTLLKSMLDLTSIDGGHIEVFGKDHRKPAAREHLAYLAEQFVAPHYATGSDFLRYVTRLHGITPTTTSIAEECRGLELDADVLRHPAGRYSKGMMQKLGLIGCLLTRRPLLVLDEPMSGLDPQARALFKSRLGQLKDAGVTVLFSTHSLEDIAAGSDRVAVLNLGRICFIGTVGEFRGHYPAVTLEQSFLHCIGAAA